jgi:hypothetical protein
LRRTTFQRVRRTSVVSLKNVIKIVWYKFVWLSSLNNTMSLVSGFRFQVSEKDDRMRIRIILNVTRFFTLTPDTRHLKPVCLKEKIDRLTPYYISHY